MVERFLPADWRVTWASLFGAILAVSLLLAADAPQLPGAIGSIRERRTAVYRGLLRTDFSGFRRGRGGIWVSGDNGFDAECEKRYESAPAAEAAKRLGSKATGRRGFAEAHPLGPE